MNRDWLDENIFDNKTIERVKSMTDEEYLEAFTGSLKFGTAGLRGIMDAGTNRMNYYTVKRAAVAVAKWILLNKKEKNGIVIAYDVRYNSDKFAELTAEVMDYYNINYVLYSGYTATPELSYAVRKGNFFAGIMVTASHNPKDYNGYKLYGSKGSQILEDDATIIENFMNKVEFKKLKEIKANVFKTPNYELLKNYFNDIIKLSLDEEKSNFNLVYSPFNGCGLDVAKKILEFKEINYFIPEEQEFRDPDFTTIPYPNPEVDSTFSLSIKLADSVNANIIIVNDPDADRIRVGVRIGDKFKLFTGNELGAILVYYILNKRKESGLNNDGYIVKTIVTDDLGIKIAKDFGYKTAETLTGFKNISLYANNLADKETEFIIGYEESIGYEIGSLVRDKDGLSTLLYVIEAINYFKRHNMSLIDVLKEIYEKYGYHLELNFSRYFEGLSSNEDMNNKMNQLRNEFSSELFKIKIKEKIDYLNSKNESLRTNALTFVLENGVKVSFRPSGTEPKLKIYMYGVGNEIESIKKELENLKANIEDFLK